jgi:predicted nucleotidyltransferase
MLETSRSPTPASSDRPRDTLALIRICLEQFGERLDAFDVVLFGSRARGTEGPRSDFDIGIRGPIPVPLGLFYDLEHALDELDTLDRVNLVDLSRASSTLAAEADRDGKVIRARRIR